MQENIRVNTSLMQQETDIPLRDSVFYTLRKNILSGELKPGEHLTEIRLGKMLGTSRTPIREAIRRLEKEGLVTIYPRSGAVVAPISERDLKDVLEVRRTLDVLCARLAAQRISDEEKSKLKKALEAFDRAADTADRIEIAKADVEIHDIIARAAGNRKLLEILSTLADQVYRYRYEYIKDDLNYDRLRQEHADIVDAIIRGDAEAAAAASAGHVEHQEEAIREQLKKQQEKHT